MNLHKYNYRAFISIIYQFCILIISSILLNIKSYSNGTFENFIFISRYGLVIIIMLLFLNMWQSKKIVSLYIVLFVFFVLFQFGVPILYAINLDYTNYYIGLISDSVLVVSAKYSVFCIQIFNLGYSVQAVRSNKTTLKSKEPKFLSNQTLVAKYAYFMFILMGIIAIPLAVYIAFMSSKYGYSYVKINSAGTNIPFFRFVRSFFIPSGILYLVYSESNKKKGVVYWILIGYSVLSMSSGGRTEGLALIAALILYNQSFGNRHKISKNIKFIIIGFFILILVPFIAQSRHYKSEGSILESLNNILINNPLEQMIGEMGFNFTSICFVTQFIPSMDNYKYGSSYLASFISIIPKSIDPTGFIEKLHDQLGEIWLSKILHSTYGTLFDFGVGFSVIAESYYNFGSYGIFPIFLIGLLIGRFLSKDLSDLTFYGRYIQIVMFWALVTFPRRQFFELIKACEYYIIFPILFIYIYKSLNRKKFQA